MKQRGIPPDDISRLRFVPFSFLSCVHFPVLHSKHRPNKIRTRDQSGQTMSLSTSKPSGGLKGFLERATTSFGKAFDLSREWGWYLAQKGGTVGLFLASTSMVVLMPLIFEINREVMVRAQAPTETHAHILSRILVVYVRVVIVVLSVV
jgi:hypothetical protein